MDVLLTILKYAVVGVLASSLIEALALSVSKGWRSYDWKAAGVPVVDFLVREYPLRLLLPLAFWYGCDGLVLAAPPLDLADGSLERLGRVLRRTRVLLLLVPPRSASGALVLVHARHPPFIQSIEPFGRLSLWMDRQLTGTLAFFMLAPLFGMPPRIVLMLLSLNLLYQFWIHATWIPRLGPLEWILNTPSAHRVHHATNLDYLDGNYGGVLIVFDRLFGTYIAEQADTPCRYELIRPMTSYNLLVIEFDQWGALWRDLRRATSVGEALGFLLKPPGWRPDGLGETTEDLRRIGSGIPQGSALESDRLHVA